MMRTAFQPLAHLVDAAAEKWLAAEHAPAPEKHAIRDEIKRTFNIGDKAELTFHGTRYLLTLSRNLEATSSGYDIVVHEIVLSG